MRPLIEDQVRAAFVNADPDEVRLAAMPHDFVLTDWDHLDFFACRDPRAGKRGYLIAERDGKPVAVVLNASDAARVRSAMCDMCHTMQPGNQVALFRARRAGEAGARGDSVAAYMCVDLSCHENVRLAAPLAPNEVRADGIADWRIDQTHARIEAFVDRVRA